MTKDQSVGYFKHVLGGKTLTQAEADEIVAFIQSRVCEDKKFHMGDRVRITGKTVYGGNSCIGEEFVIDEIDKPTWDRKGYSNHIYGNIWPASSLELVEPELKIGDWVEVIGPNERGERVHIGHRFQIDQVWKDEGLYSKRDVPYLYWYPVSSLRKIQPDQAIAAAGKAEAIRELLAPLVDERFKDTDKRLTKIENVLLKVAEELR